MTLELTAFAVKQGKTTHAVVRQESQVERVVVRRPFYYRRESLPTDAELLAIPTLEEIEEDEHEY